MRHWLLLAALLLPSHAAAITLDEAIARALAESSTLESLRKNVESARREMEAANRLLANNPELGLELGGVRGAGAAFAVAAVQPLELGGQMAARRKAARAGLDRAEAALDAYRQQLVGEVREAFVRYLAASSREQLAGDVERLAAQAVEASQARFEAGQLSRLERNAARVERGRAVRDRAAAVTAGREALAALRRLLSLPSHATLEPEGSLDPADLPQPPALDDLIVRARAGRRDLVAATRTREAARARSEFADALAFPAVSVGAYWEREVGEDKIMGTLSVPIPFFDRNDAERAQARVDLSEAEAELTGVERSITEEVEVAATRLEAARRAVQAFETETLEALEENLELATEAYRAGRLDALGWLLVWRETLEGRSAWIDVREELALAQVALERALGIAAPPR